MKSRIFNKATSCLVVVAAVLVWLGVFVAAAAELKPLYPHYPAVFDVTGKLDVIGYDSIVINDSSFGLSPSVVYYGPWGKIGRGGITLNSKVGCVVQEGGKIESVWLLEKSSRAVRKKNTP